MHGCDAVKSPFFHTALPTIISIVATDNPVVGEEFSIECTVAGIPLPIILWQFNNSTLEVDNNLRIVETSNGLMGQTSRVEVTDATSKFGGMYICIVFNDAGSVDQSVLIELQRKSH